jgi:ribosomal protein L11 methyltransferase
MDYYELLFTANSPLDTTIVFDILASELGEIGFESFMQNSDGLLAYIPITNFQTEKLEKRLSHFPLENVTFRYTFSIIKAKDWNEVWEKNYFRPVRFGNDCLLRAPFHPSESGYRFEIMINPKMAFGTGNHETTNLMIRTILALELEGKEVLDMGCGTAVLAILAAKKGAGRVVAIDIDEWAYQNAIENCHQNDTQQIHVILGGAEQIASVGMFDYIFANINRNILLTDILAYCKALKPDGEIFMSGFYDEDIPVIEAKCNEYGLALLSFTEQKNWVAIRVVRCITRINA